MIDERQKRRDTAMIQTLVASIAEKMALDVNEILELTWKTHK